MLFNRGPACEPLARCGVRRKGNHRFSAEGRREEQEHPRAGTGGPAPRETTNLSVFSSSFLFETGKRVVLVTFSVCVGWGPHRVDNAVGMAVHRDTFRGNGRRTPGSRNSKKFILDSGGIRVILTVALLSRVAQWSDSEAGEDDADKTVNSGLAHGWILSSCQAVPGQACWRWQDRLVNVGCSGDDAGSVRRLKPTFAQSVSVPSLLTPVHAVWAVQRQHLVSCRIG